MANHKRGKRKNARAGCLLCHPYKANGVKGAAIAVPVRDRRRIDHDEISAGVAEHAEESASRFSHRKEAA